MSDKKTYYRSASDAKVFIVLAGGERATIVVRSWARPGGTYGGELMIHSSFGSWGNAWSCCSEPFPQFLAGCGFDYLFTKLMGGDFMRFDGGGSVVEVFASIIRKRRANYISTAAAREAWDALLNDEVMDGEPTEQVFGDAMLRIAGQLDLPDLHDNFADPCSWPRVRKPDEQASGFWRELWPVFLECLKAEGLINGTPSGTT